MLLSASQCVPLTTIPFFLKSLINKMSVKGLFNSQSFHSKIWSIQFVTSLLKSAKSSLLIAPAFIRLRISTKKSLRLISIKCPKNAGHYKQFINCLIPFIYSSSTGLTKNPKNPSPTSGDSLSFNIKDCYGLISYYNVLPNSLMYLRKASRVSG